MVLSSYGVGKLDGKKEGNHWSNWLGVGMYSIDGSAGSVDPYPLSEIVNPPIILEFRQTYAIPLLLSNFLISVIFAIAGNWFWTVLINRSISLSITTSTSDPLLITYPFSPRFCAIR